MKKANINFSPLERAYNEEFGQFPDYHYTTLRKKYDRETTAQIIQRNMDFIWNREKEKSGYMKNGFFNVKDNNEIPFLESEKKQCQNNLLNV